MIYYTIIDDVLVKAEITHRGYAKDELRCGESEWDIELIGVEPDGIFKTDELERLVLKRFITERNKNYEN